MRTEDRNLFGIVVVLARAWATAHIVWKSSKMSHLNVSILAFFTNFWPIKTDISGNTVWHQALCFQKLAKLDHFWHFVMNLSTRNVNVARFARNVEWDFFCDFQTPWIIEKWDVTCSMMASFSCNLEAQATMSCRDLSRWCRAVSRRLRERSLHSSILFLRRLTSPSICQ